MVGPARRWTSFRPASFRTRSSTPERTSSPRARFSAGYGSARKGRKSMILEPIRVLSMAEMERIHEGALHVLERVGMRFESARALAYLRKAGCAVDEQSRVVKFPKRVVQEAVDRMRRAYDNPDRLPARM